MHDQPSAPPVAPLPRFLPWAFLVGLPALCHLAFSWVGFNPTDDGFILAYSRRLLAGQVPHLDFISIRPVGSPLLHLPEVWLGGEYTFWLSRAVVWCELAAIAWVWTGLLRQALRLPTRAGEHLALALLAFALSVYYFPLMAWHTIDGLFLTSLGLLLASSSGGRRAVAGYLLIGAAGLCKQNFLVMAPLTLLLLGDWRRWRCCVAAAAPGLAYALVMVALGAGRPAWEQLTVQHGLLAVGVKPYLLSWDLFSVGASKYVVAAAMPAAVTVGLLLAHLTFGASRRGWSVAGALWLLIMAGAAATMAGGQYEFYSRGLLWMAAICCLYAFRRGLPGAPLSAVCVAAAWASGISLGHPFPGLLAGPLALITYGYWRRARPETPAKLPALLCGLAALVVVTAWAGCRLERVYRDRPAAELTFPLGTVLPGGRLIRTNPTTGAFLADLQRQARQAEAEHMSFAVLPDSAGTWVGARRLNPLSIDWPENVELATPALAQRVEADLLRLRGKGEVFLQRVDAANLGSVIPPTTATPDPLGEFVRGHFRLVRRSEFFEVYR